MMKKLLLSKKIGILLIVLVGLWFWFGNKSFAQTTGDYRSSATGNWATTGTWQRYNGTTWVAAVVIPGTTNNVTVQAGHTVTMDSNPGACKDLTIAGVLTFTNTRTLAASGNLLISGGTLRGTATGTLNVAGTFSVPTSVSANIQRVTITVTGTTSIAGVLSFATSATGTKTFVGMVTINLGGTWNNTINSAITFNGGITNNGTFAAGSGNQTFGGTTKTISGTSNTTFGPVIIANGATYTINSNTTCSSLTFATGNNTTSLTHGANSSLTVNGAVTINQPGASVTKAWNINAGSATVTGLITFAGTSTTTTRIGKIVITTGTLNANGGITFAASSAATKVIDMSGGAGVLNLKGALTVASSTLTAGTAGSIFNYAGNANQTVNFFSAGAYHNLYINNIGTTGATLSAPITATNVTGNVRVQTGILNNGGFAISGSSGDTFEVLNGAKLVLTGTSTMPTGFGTISLENTSTVDYAGANQAIAATTYGNIILSGSGTKTAGGAISVNGTTALNGVMYNSGGFSSSLGVLSLGSNSTIALGAGNHSLTFSDSHLVPWAGSTLTITGWAGTAGASGTAGKIFVGVGGLDDTQLGNVSFTTFPGTPIILGTGELVPPIATASLPTDYFRSKSNGDWGSTSTWESSHDGTTNWINATLTPTNTAQSILIQTGDAVYATTSPSSNNLTVKGTYEHRLDAGTIPTAIWDANSTCLITGITTTVPIGLAQAFQNFTWDCAGQTSRELLYASGMQVNADFNVTDTGTSHVYFSDGTNTTVSFAGNYIQSGGDMRFARGNGNADVSFGGNLTITGGTLTIDDGDGGSSLSVAGNYTQTGGIFDFAGTTGTSSLNLSGNFTHSAPAESMSTTGSGANGTIVFNKNGIQSLSFINPKGAVYVHYLINSGSTLQLLSSFALVGDTDPIYTGEIIVNGTIDLASYTITQSGFTGTLGPAVFTLNSGATLITANPGGIDGSVLSTNMTRTFNSGADYIFNGSAAQITSAGLPATVSNLTIDNTSGVTIDPAKTVTNNLSITLGSKANLGAFTHTAGSLTLGGVVASIGSWGSNASSATNKSDTYFTTGVTGIVNVGSGSCITGTWLGTTSTDWNIASNWCGGIPTASTDVIIPSVVNQPVIGVAGGLCHDITINNGASLTISGSNTLTVAGNWINNGTFTSGTGTVTMTGADKILGGTTSTTFNNLTLGDGNAKNYSLQNSQNVNGTLTFSNNALLTLGSFNLTLGASSPAVSGSFWTGSMIIADGSGELRKIFTGNGSFTFPIGDNSGGADYTPITLNFTAGTYAANAFASVKVTDDKHPSNSSPANYLTRYWTVDQSGISGFSCDVTGTYIYSADVVGQEDLSNAVEYTGSLPWLNYSALGGNTLTATGVTTFGDFTGMGLPLITTNTASLTGFTYAVGTGPSGNLSVYVNGVNLSGDIVVTPPTDFEVCLTSNGTYQSTALTITQTGGVVNNIPFYVRMKAGLSAGSYSNETIACSSTGATTKNVTVSGTVTGSGNTISTGTITGAPFCAGADISVPYTISGTYTSGNVFTAQLSDASGSFASPISIGTVTSTSAGTISATIPLSTSGGGAYRVRVVSNNPAIAGTDNGSNLTVNVIPDFSGTVTNATCPSSSDGGISISDLPTALTFSNSDHDYIDLGDNFLSDLPQFTLEGWIIVDKSTIGSRIGLFGQNDAIEFGFVNNTTIEFWTPTAGAFDVSLSFYPNDNAWHHIAVTGNSSNMFMYIDGVQVASRGGVANYGSSSENVRIGASIYDPTTTTTGGFTGQMLKVGFWSTALNSADISNLASGFTTYTGNETGLLAGYNFFDSTSGTTLSSLGSISANGTLENTPLWTELYTYTWTKSEDGSFTRSTKDITGLTSGSYTLLASVGTCTKSKSFSVGSINPGLTPAVTIAASPGGAICSGTSVTFTATSTNLGGGAETYDFKIGGTSVQSSATNTYTSTTLANGNEVTCDITVTGGTCLTSTTAFSNTITMTVSPDLPASVSIGATATTICSGTSVSFTATPTNGGTTPTYQWKLNGNSVGGGSDTYTSSTLANTDVVSCVMTSNATPCLTGSPATSNPITMTVSPLSVGGSVSGGTTVCSGSTSGLLTLSGYAGTVTKWQSSTDGTNWTDITNDLITYTSGVLTQTTQFRAVVISGTCSLANSSPTTVTVPVITINDGVPSSICQWSLVSVSASASGGTAPYTYSWEDSAGGPYFPGNVTTYSGSSPFISTSGINTGTYTNNLKLTVVDALGCTEVKLISVTVTPSVNSSWIAHPTAVCAGENGTIYTAEYLDNTTYAWTVSGGTIASGDETNSITVNWGTGATGTVDVQTVTNLSCTQNLSQTVTIRPILGITLGTNPTVCLGTTIASLPYSAKIGNPNRYNIDFDALANTVGLVDVTSATLGSAPGNISITLPVNLPVGTYNGSLTLSDFTVTPVCTNTYPITIKVNPDLPASVSIVATATTICSGTSVTFTATPANGGTSPTYQWKLNGNSVGGGSDTYTSSTLANGDVITVQLTSNAPCVTGSPASSSGITMSVTPTVATPVFALGATSNRCQEAGPVTYTATATNSSLITYSLDIDSSTAGNSIDAGTGIVTYVEDWSGTTIITANAAGCNGPKTATHTVTVHPLPNPGTFITE